MTEDNQTDDFETVTEPCPFCTDGIETVTRLIGDGQPGVETRIESKEQECRACNGTGEIEHHAE